MLLFTLVLSAQSEPIQIHFQPSADAVQTSEKNLKKTKRRARKRRMKANRTMHGISVGLGSLGAAIGYVYAPNHKISFSGQYSMLPAPATEYTFSEEGSAYTDTTNLSTFTLRGNVHPIAKFKWFHVSAGIAYSMSSISLELPDGTHTVGEEADTSTSATGSVDFSDIQPYIGIGGGYTNKKGFQFFLDLGANYQGAPVVDMVYESTASQDAIDIETDSVKTYYSSFQFYPVLQLGVNYMF
jgi:hypothetical protein